MTPSHTHNATPPIPVDVLDWVDRDDFGHPKGLAGPDVAAAAEPYLAEPSFGWTASGTKVRAAVREFSESADTENCKASEESDACSPGFRPEGCIYDRTAADRDAAEMAAAFNPPGSYRSDRDRLIDGEWGPGVADSLELMGMLVEREAGR
jgi:hypothetical protein